MHINRQTLSYGWAVYYSRIEILLVNTPTASCVYILVGLSADRYVAACRPGSYRKVSSPGVASYRIACSLLLPLLFYIPHCFLGNVVCNDQGMGWTFKSNGVEKHIAWIIWAWVVELCHRLLPSLLIVFFNINVIIKVRHVNRQFMDKNNPKKSIDEQIMQRKISESSKSCESRDCAKVTISTSNPDEDKSQPLLVSSPDARQPQESENVSRFADSSLKNSSSRSLKKDSVRKARTSREQLERQLFNLLLSIIVVFLITTLPAAILALTDTANAKFESFGYEVRYLLYAYIIYVICYCQYEFVYILYDVFKGKHV